MKKLALLVPVTLLFCLFLSPFSGSAKEDKSGAQQERLAVYIEIKLDNGETVGFFGEGTTVETSSSVFLKTYKIKLPGEAMEQIDFGYFANKIIGAVVTLSNEEKIVGVGFLNKAGYLNFTVHKNGSGGYFPKGWF
ncbi:hypothetical protein [Maribellus maritimus]|uniref:hypothetical protein n=1 Tax=Maribellus maritimus TaxID=2870838 RepID=UPI001EEC6805|nr:hypothetical protein [Maribellus maritimus]MCG6187499.1 hypothetical protein [Maribellus maritimus]